MSEDVQTFCEQPRQKVLQRTLQENELMTNSECTGLSVKKKKKRQAEISCHLCLCFSFCFLKKDDQETSDDALFHENLINS